MGMFYNGAKCDIYIGKGAGKMLMKDILNAEKSVKIVSPYLSPFLIKELIKIRKKNIEVQLITTDNMEDYHQSYEKNIHQLIIQHRILDKEADKLRNKWIDITKILLYTLWGLIATMLLLVYFSKDLKVVFGIIPIAMVFLIYKLYKSKIANKRIYNYKYTQLFPFKVYLSPTMSGLSDTFIHSKIYLIDDSIAYLGSLNFTYNGTRNNHETRVKTTDTEAVTKIKDKIHKMFYHSSLPEINIQQWGTRLYKEPIN